MSILTIPFYDVLSGDPSLIAMLAAYKGESAIFTIDPVPGDADYPLIVTAGEVSQIPNDSKNCEGRSIIRDIRIYTAADGSSVTIEAIAERVRYLFHRMPLIIPGYTWILSDVGGPIVANEADYYGRILSVSVIAQENQSYI